MASLETDAQSLDTGVATGGRWVLALVVAALGAAALLWWRFGEGVYATSIMNAILACF